MKKILLVGSSIFMGWRDAKTVAPDCIVANLAVSGTITSYWIEHLPEALTTETPDIVLFYCGSNDINKDMTEEHISSNIAHCCKIIHDQPQPIDIAYFSIIKAPQKNDKLEFIDRLNNTVKNDLIASDLYVESNDVFFCDGRPVNQYFIDDGLHLTDEAYTVLSDYAKPLISSWMAR